MKNDPVIQSIRKVRHRISEAVDHDPRKLVECYRKRQEHHRDRVVRRRSDESKSQEENAA